jgi:hypothetical protein
MDLERSGSVGRIDPQSTPVKDDEEFKNYEKRSLPDLGSAQSWS